MCRLRRERLNERSSQEGEGKDDRRFGCFLKEKHLVFTGAGTDGGLLGGGEGSYDGGEHHVWALGGVDGLVEAASAVVLDQGGGLPVVGVQAGMQRRLVVVAAADERLTSHLGGSRRKVR